MSLKIQLKDYHYFGSLEYLRIGTDRQQEAYTTLKRFNVMQSLAAYDPMLVGTIPINIDIASSDLDLICCYAEKSAFRKTIVDKFRTYPGFEIKSANIRGHECMVAKFTLDSFPVEIFGQSIPVRQQMGYLHMITEAALLKEHGESFSYPSALINSISGS